MKKKNDMMCFCLTYGTKELFPTIRLKKVVPFFPLELEEEINEHYEQNLVIIIISSSIVNSYSSRTHWI